MRVLFFDVGYTLVNEDAVWEDRCREQAQTDEAKKLGLSAADIYHEIEIASISRKPQFRTLIDKYSFKEVAPYRTELETLYNEAPAVIKALSQKYELGIIANQLDGLKERLLPAKALGIKTVWIKQGFGALQKPLSKSEEPDHSINNLSELLEIF